MIVTGLSTTAAFERGNSEENGGINLHLATVSITIMHGISARTVNFGLTVSVLGQR